MKTLVGSAALVALLAGPALAADYPVRGPAPVYRVAATPVFTWTGCYIGVQGGWAWGQSKHETAIGTISHDYNVEGGLAGGTLGCNYQTGLVVFGVEGDLSWVGKKGEGPVIAPVVGTAVAETRETWLGTIRGRLGFAPDDRWLVFITGGYAVAGVEASVFNVPLGLGVTEKKTRGGWTAGLGVEWVFWGNWSAKAEYLYVGLEGKGYFDASPLVVPRSDVTLDNHIMRAGINYRFGWSDQPVVARY